MAIVMSAAGPVVGKIFPKARSKSTRRIDTYYYWAHEAFATLTLVDHLNKVHSSAWTYRISLFAGW
jgi:hypothetical protein